MAKKAIAGEKPRLLNLFCNWVHQAFFYLDRVEQIGRILLEGSATLLLATTFAVVTDRQIFDLLTLAVCFLIIHTFNWVFNGNLWACILFAFPKLRNPGETVTCQYLNDMAERLKNNPSISGLLIFGSLSRGKWHDRSDIDLRILRKPGFCNALCALSVQMRERLIAFFAKQPLDMYLADNVDFLMNMRKDEPPIFLLMRDARLEKTYPLGREIHLERLR